MTDPLRQARETDVDALVALRAQMFDDMGMAATDDRWQANCRAWFLGSLVNPDVLVLVAEEEGGG